MYVWVCEVNISEQFNKIPNRNSKLSDIQSKLVLYTLILNDLEFCDMIQNKYQMDFVLNNMIGLLDNLLNELNYRFQKIKE